MIKRLFTVFIPLFFLGACSQNESKEDLFSHFKTMEGIAKSRIVQAKYIVEGKDPVKNKILARSCFLREIDFQTNSAQEKLTACVINQQPQKELYLTKHENHTFSLDISARSDKGGDNMAANGATKERIEEILQAFKHEFTQTDLAKMIDKDDNLIE